MSDSRERIKTDVRLPYSLSHQVATLAKLIGVPKNAFITMAVAEFCIKLAPLVSPGKPRSKMITEAQEIFQTILNRARRVQ